MQNKIVSPYEGVDFESVGFYKTALHVHSAVSDGRVDFSHMIEAHFNAGFDVLAMTDHGSVCENWTSLPESVWLLRKIKHIKINPHPLERERAEQIALGTGRAGRGMTAIPMSIEQNAYVPGDSHVCTYFVDYGQGKLGRIGDYETCIKNVDRLGGLSILNHLGIYTRAKSKPENANKKRYIRKFSSLFMKYPSLLGIDINSKRDTGTKNTRALYDNILKSVMPTGRNVWCFASSDAHSAEVIENGYIYLLMTENTPANIKAAMKNGHLFAVAGFDANVQGDDFIPVGAPPIVKRVGTEDNTINLITENTDEIRWIADGRVIAAGASFSLQEHISQVNSYVRAELFGQGGVCYSQPFRLNF